MTSEIIQCFETFQKERSDFVRTVSELATDPVAAKMLHKVGVLDHLKPLLIDNVPSIQQYACLAIGRLSSNNEQFAKAVASSDVLHQLVYSLQEQGKKFKKSAAFVLRSVAKQSHELASAVVDAGAVEALVRCLGSSDNSVKEAAAFALDYIARHSSDLARKIVDQHGIEPLLACASEQDLALQQIAVCTLADVVKHTSELAKCVLDKKGLETIAPLIFINDTKLRRQVCVFLAQVAKHNSQFAQNVVDHKDVLKCIVESVNSTDLYLKANAAACLRVISKHSNELASTVYHAKAVDPLVNCIKEGNALLQAIYALGNIANFSENFAEQIIQHEIVPYLYDIIAVETIQDHIQCAAIYTLGMLGQHSFRQTKVIAEEKCIELLVKINCTTKIPSLKTESFESLKKLIRHCNEVVYLNPLLEEETPWDLREVVAEHLSRFLRASGKAAAKQRRIFVETKGLYNLLKIKQQTAAQVSDRQDILDTKSRVAGYINSICTAYPHEVVRYHTPNYYENLIAEHSRTGEWRFEDTPR